MNFINLCPHPIKVFTTKGGMRVFDPDGRYVRVKARTKTVDTIDGIRIGQQTLGEVANLPEAEKGTVFIVSSMVQNALQEAGINRPDVLSPGTGMTQGPIRDDRGNIIAVTQLVRKAPKTIKQTKE